jgi:hypothetical protein
VAGVQGRDLLDSMYKGFPVGYLLFWEAITTRREVLMSLDQLARSLERRLN